MPKLFDVPGVARSALVGPAVDVYGGGMAHYNNPHEINPISDADVKIRELAKDTVSWADGRLAKITRLRLLTDPDFPAFDVSYCHGVLKDGTPVVVDVPFSQLPRRGARKAIVAHAKRDGVYAKRLGIFEAISILF